MLVLLSVITASAKPRTADQMKRIAQNTIQRKSLARNSAKKGAAQLKTLLRTEDLPVQVYTYLYLYFDQINYRDIQ